MDGINEELMLFIHDITLFLQDHSNHNAEKIEPMFQRAYKLYVKYDVEKKGLELNSDRDQSCRYASGCGFDFCEGEECEDYLAEKSSRRNDHCMKAGD